MAKVSVVVSCIDHRFWPEANELLTKEFGEFDSIELAGASKNIASPLHESDRHVVLENIALSISLHHAGTLVLTNHRDCGAYGGSKAFASYEEELAFHRTELARAADIARKKFPELRVRTVFLTREPDGTVTLIHE